MAQLIQLKRRIPGTGAPGTLAAGEPAVSVTAGGVGDAYVGDRTAVRTLVSATRQVEVTGDQSVAGNKTFTGSIVAASPAVLDVGGGNDGDVLTTDGAGALTWQTPASPVSVGTTAPSTPSTGDFWYNTN